MTKILFNPLRIFKALIYLGLEYAGPGRAEILFNP